MVADGRREDGQVGRQHPPAARRARRVRARRVLMCLVGGHYRKPVAFTPRSAGGGGAAPWSACASCAAARRRAPRRRSWTRSCERVLRRARRRLQHARGAGRAVRLGRARPTGAWTRARARAPASCGEMLHVFGLERCSTSRRSGAPEEVERLPPSASRRVRDRDFERADRLRDELARARAGRSATRADGAAARAAAAVIVYGRNPVREALRGRRARPARVGDRAGGGRAVAAGRRGDDRRRRTRSRSAAARPTTRASCAEVERLPLRDADALLEADDALVVASTRCRTRTTSAPSAASPSAAGAPGVVHPRAPRRRGHPRGLQGVRRRRRAPADRARAQPRRLPGGGQGARGLGLRRRGGRADAVRPSPTTAAGWCSCSGRRAAACARGSPRPATSWSPCPSAAGSARSTSPPPPRRSCTGSCSPQRRLDKDS